MSAPSPARPPASVPVPVPVPVDLLEGELCQVAGTVRVVRFANPCTKSRTPSRRWMLLLTDVELGCPRVPYARTPRVWLLGGKRLHPWRRLPAGARVTLSGRFRSYTARGEVLQTIGFPYSRLRVFPGRAPGPAALA